MSTMLATETQLELFLEKVRTRRATAGIVGLGYVGLPLAQLFTSRGFQVVGYDIDSSKTERLTAGESYIGHIPDSQIREMQRENRFVATTDFARIEEADTLSICVPTPLDSARQPDLTAVRNTCEAIVPHLRRGQLVILESTTYPGTTADVVLPILAKSGLRVGVDYFLGYSPEREDPANPRFTARTIPKVVGANDQASRKALETFYASVFDRIVPVSSCEAAELTKLLENIYRCVNIALVNELKLLCQRMELNVWEIIEAAASKPFGFQAFYPGPGLGGHCIPIDPFYLSWKAREFDFTTRFIELAGEVNTAMPYQVVHRVVGDLNHRGIATTNASVLVLGIAYKKNVDDCRESPAIKVMKLLSDEGIRVLYYDPHTTGYVSKRYGNMPGEELPELTDQALIEPDATLILTDHDAFDAERIVRLSKRVIDTRNATRDVAHSREKILLA